MLEVRKLTKINCGALKDLPLFFIGLLTITKFQYASNN